MKKKLTNNDAFYAQKTLQTIDSESFKFNLAVLRCSKVLGDHIALVQELIKGKEEKKIEEIAREEVEIDLPVIDFDLIPEKLTMPQTAVLMEFFVEEEESEEPAPKESDNEINQEA